MNDFCGVNTGMQNPIFKIMIKQNQQMNQDLIFQNQTGIQGELNNQMVNQNMNMGMMENNQMNNPMSQMNQSMQNPMEQNNEMNKIMMNNKKQNKQNVNQRMDMGLSMSGMNPLKGNPNPMNMNNNQGMI